jgi:23S rRNA (guanosine2251-2'-O)-methyltransferase
MGTPTPEITLYGRMPVLEALSDPHVSVERVVVARNARGESVDSILSSAAARGVRLERAPAERVTRLSRNGRHDQGVVAMVSAPGLEPLGPWLASWPGAVRLLLLDGLTNPSNVGMIIRTAVAAGIDGVVLPRAGTADLGPLVVKASAGVALRARLLLSASAIEAAEALQAGDVALVGLAAGAGDSLWSAGLPPRVAFVLGNETGGVSGPVADLVDRWWSIPLAGGVESLNVAVAAAVVCFELARRAALPAPGA